MSYLLKLSQPIKNGNNQENINLHIRLGIFSEKWYFNNLDSCFLIFLFTETYVSHKVKPSILVAVIGLK